MRFSLSGLNTHEEVEVAVAAVRELAAQGKSARLSAFSPVGAGRATP